MLTDDEIKSQVLAAFQEEQAEHRQAAGELLLQLEHDPQHTRRQELLDQLFREAHSLKGGARAAGQQEVEQIAHQIEDLFSAVRRQELELTPTVCDPIYASLDAIGVLMAQVGAGQQPAIEPYEPLMAMLNSVLHQGYHEQATASIHHRQPTIERLAVLQPPANEVSSPLPCSADEPRRDSDMPGEGSGSTVRIATATLDLLLNETGELMTCNLRSQQRARECSELGEITARWRRLWRQVQPAFAKLQERAPSIRPAVHYLADREVLPVIAPAPAFGREMSMVLDALKEANGLLSEIDRRLGQHERQVVADTNRLGAVAERLYSQVRRARMLPLASIIGQIRLQVREIARTADKHIVLDIDDGGAEADRQVLDRLREVLLHLVRNAIDHGIEAANVRRAAGKAAEGRIMLRAEVSGDRLTLVLTDDGAGLNIEAIRQRALSSGVLGAIDLERMDDGELTDLIFLPGFSTRQTVSTLSGRGVGLDIVRAHVERMHGRVSVQSLPGVGCSFTISVPLSLTSSHGLLLRAGQARYVIPLDAVQRIVPAKASDIRRLEGRAALVVDGRPLQLVHLAELLGGEISSRDSRQQAESLALLLGSGERQVACLVDEVLSEQELVMHRLPAPLQQVRFIAGATIMADGRVVPLLDVVDLLRAAIGSNRSVNIAPEVVAPEPTQTVLVVDDSITTRTLEKNILEGAGYRVRLATDGIEALQLLEQMAENGGCNLLLSDVDMPRLNGFDLTTQVRADSRFKHLPVVLVTSLDTPADRERGIAAGADAYIVKRTFEQQVLLETIAQLI